jgi:amino acid adenylation domain-containing protein
MQAGMLYQSMLGGESTSGGHDIEQMHLLLAEEIDLAAFARAWTHVARRHGVLSTSFRWDAGEQPSQRVIAGVVVPVDSEDWSALGEAELDRRRAAFLASDRARGFNLRVAPLMRVRVFPLGEGQTEVVWTLHHILLDGRSMVPVLREVFAVYADLRRGERVVAPPAPRPYSDYVAWLARLEVAKSRPFFCDLLRGKASPTPLPAAEAAARPLPREGYGEHARRVDEAVARGVRELARRTRTTVGTVVQAAWAIVLARFTGDDDVLFGTTRACRRTALGGDAEQMIGLFINTLPVRVRVADEIVVADLLADLRAQSVAMRAHEHTSLVEVHGQSEIPRGTPLFETLLMFENRELNRSLRAGGDTRWSGRIATLHERPSPPLNVTVVDDADLEIHVLFDRRRFTDRAAARLGAALAAGLAGLALGEERQIGDVDVVPAEDRRTMLVAWNDTARAFNDELCIHEPFEARATTQPDAVAVEMDGESLTYRELDERANRLAHALQARGARAGTFVAICLDRSLDLVVALIGVAKSGAAYVPLDPSHPPDRLAFLLADAGARLVVTEERWAPLFAGSAAAAAIAIPIAIAIDGASGEAIARMSAARPIRTARATSACYAIFTSGSTGQPKGVVLSHRAVINTFDWVTRTFAIGPGDRLLFVTSPCFDLSVYDTFGALGAGATVVVASSALLADPGALTAAITDLGITVWDSAPAALQRLAPFFPPAPGCLSRGAPLRVVLLSGDWIPLTLPGAIVEAFPLARVISLGGATEAAIWSNWFPIDAVDPRWTSIPYGRPIQNARYHVLDRGMRPAPIGAVGDLYIGGACLADGYLNRAELTRERFVPDPFASTPGERLYRTGDLARYFDDGELEFLGRSDFQVKIRGFRVELGEVEAAIGALPEVREVVCTARVDASGQRALVAYVIAGEGEIVDAQTIRESLGRTLPQYMVPSHVVELEAFPLSCNGKLDRNALPSPGAAAAAAFVAPSTTIERAMARIWEELLQRERVGVHESFFDLGGHSLLAVMLVSRVRRQMGVDLPLARVLQKPTIALLAASLDGAPPSAHGDRHLITLNDRGCRTPLLLVPGIGGHGFIYQRLTRALGEAQPLHVLQALGVDAAEGASRTIEEMAEIYEPAILRAVAEGPIAIGGYSFGALIAFELAHRLRLRGRSIPLLISFDGFAPGYPSLLPLPQRALAHLRELSAGDGSQREAYLRGRINNVRARILRQLGRGEETVDDVPNADTTLNQRLRRSTLELWRARNLYRPDRVEPSSLLLVKAEIATRWPAHAMNDPLYGWRAFVEGRIDVESIPGEHLTMFEEGNCDRIAAAIAPYLARLGKAR